MPKQLKSSTAAKHEIQVYMPILNKHYMVACSCGAFGAYRVKDLKRMPKEAKKHQKKSSETLQDQSEYPGGA